MYKWVRQLIHIQLLPPPQDLSLKWRGQNSISLGRKLGLGLLLVIKKQWRSRWEGDCTHRIQTMQSTPCTHTHRAPTLLTSCTHSTHIKHPHCIHYVVHYTSDSNTVHAMLYIILLTSALNTLLYIPFIMLYIILLSCCALYFWILHCIHCVVHCKMSCCAYAPESCTIYTVLYTYIN